MHDGYPNRCPFNEIVKRFRSLEKIWKNDFTLTEKVKPTEGSGAISWNLSKLGAEHSLHVWQPREPRRFAPGQLPTLWDAHLH